MLREHIAEILVHEDELRQRVRDLGAEISQAYEGRKPLLVAVLKGSVIFMADLMRALTVPHAIDFMATSSYGAATESSGVVRILKDLDEPIEGKDVLIVEDIIDSGNTLHYLRGLLLARNPASLRIVSLLSKPARRQVDVPVDWIGFEIPDKFVVGYGLDFAELYRDLPFIGVLKEEYYRHLLGEED
ncbi:MAG: hypoxanthine phosphoribosyltransferase [Caldilineae bacterium]|nr:MAG: hypoxanthine phosphoribosyltransferase [Caldilineae bacterium]